jgi:hypothetical protein
MTKSVHSLLIQERKRLVNIVEELKNNSDVSKNLLNELNNSINNLETCSMKLHSAVHKCKELIL